MPFNPLSLELLLDAEVDVDVDLEPRQLAGDVAGVAIAISAWNTVCLSLSDRSISRSASDSSSPWNLKTESLSPILTVETALEMKALSAHTVKTEGTFSAISSSSFRRRDSRSTNFILLQTVLDTK